MTRTDAREIAVHFAFELAFSQEDAETCLMRRMTPEAFAALSEEEPLYREFPNRKQADYIRRVVSGVDRHGPELDAYIDQYAKGWRFARISRVAAAIMRVCMFELLYLPEVPPAAAMSAAVELSKRYEPPEVTSFINGLLGSFWRAEGPALEAMSAGRPGRGETAPKAAPETGTGGGADEETALKTADGGGADAEAASETGTGGEIDAGTAPAATPEAGS